jgi:predicted dehydrogenase
MDISYYCIAFTVALFCKPKKIQASAHLLASGVDGCGTAVLDYGQFSVTIDHSKISNSQLNNEIQGENGSLLIEHIALCENVKLTQESQHNISVPQLDYSMVYEARFFAKQINEKQMHEETVQRAKTTSAVITEIRRLTGLNSQQMLNKETKWHYFFDQDLVLL